MFFPVVFICIFNIAMWFVFFLKFRKLFSTDDVIENTRVELNKIIVDINNNAERNITLLENRIERLRAVIAEADKRLKLAEETEAKNASLSLLRNQVAGTIKKTSGNAVLQNAAEAYKRNGSAPAIKPEASVSLTKSGENAAGKSSQNTLFDTEVTVNGDGSSYAEIPIVTPEVFASETPVVRKNDLKKQITGLYDQGLSVEEIAAKLSCSTTEVQFVLDLEGKL